MVTVAGLAPPVMQTVIKDTGDRWPMLTKTNYAEWLSMVTNAHF
jgi:hypothetical protein